MAGSRWRWLGHTLRRLPGFRQEHPLAHRLTLYVLACSLGFALLSTAVQVGIEYRREMHLIEQRLELIRSGYAARLARGCTSGQGLSGGATLAVGSWIFLFACFGWRRSCAGGPSTRRSRAAGCPLGQVNWSVFWDRHSCPLGQVT